MSLSLSLWLSLYATKLCTCHLALSCLNLISITIVIISMTLYELVLHYHILSYHISCSLILSLLLIWCPFDSILFDSIESDLLYCSVSYLISMNDLCLSVYLSVCVFISMNKSFFPLLFFSKVGKWRIVFEWLIVLLSHIWFN